MKKTLDRVDEVAAWRLCMGCGACKWACPEGAVSLRDIPETGIRPIVEEAKCKRCGKCVEICPGVRLEHREFPKGAIREFIGMWGPVLGVYEGYACDPQIRFAGASGGISTALGLHGLQDQGLSAVLHVKADGAYPISNQATLSRTREDLLATTGARYAPAAPCQAFGWIKDCPGKCMFIGKPCDVAALRTAQRMDPELGQKVGPTISLFCGGTPTTAGTLAVLEAMGISEPNTVSSLRYRGNGWPGQVTATVRDSDRTYTMTYRDAWDKILARNGQVRCRLCPDGTGEFADIACGDPWHMDHAQDETGHSLVLARTALGESFLRDAAKAGCISLEERPARVLPESQYWLLRRRREVYGRLLAMRMCGIPTPEFQGFCLSENWKALGLWARARAVVGMARRVVTRGWRRPIQG